MNSLIVLLVVVAAAAAHHHEKVHVEYHPVHHVEHDHYKEEHITSVQEPIIGHEKAVSSYSSYVEIPAEQHVRHIQPVIHEVPHVHVKPIVHHIKPVVYHKQPIVHNIQPIVHHTQPIVHHKEEIVHHDKYVQYHGHGHH